MSKKKLSKTQMAAKKAWVTRHALDNVLTKYGVDTYLVVRALVLNKPKSLENERVWQGRRRVAAIQANFTRGLYQV